MMTDAISKTNLVQIAADVFVDNVLVQVTERHLLAKLERMFDEIWKLSYENKNKWDLFLFDDEYQQREARLRVIGEQEANLWKYLDAVGLVTCSQYFS